MLLIFNTISGSRMSSSPSAALPIAYFVLRLLVVLNWIVAAGMLAMLFVLPTRQWIMTSFELSPGAEADRVVMGFRAIVVIGLVTIPMNYAILKRLLAIVDTVRA